ncbi:MAG: hypothetical protein Q4P07_08440 [Ornithinimicrobium sp.]|uniref:hypothetical protein n=1 Tax=Ornithinimicrobium sp. TaxID=1977084 RepID=UPI0026E0F4F7|nr:hypothetical protein [Ornithinimicrobium sp.]MDO5740161.1 hypothetical protein [Ornithinimicrobium sp.]
MSTPDPAQGQPPSTPQVKGQVAPPGAHHAYAPPGAPASQTQPATAVQTAAVQPASGLQPTAQASPAPQPTRSATTSRLRLARGLATAAALLTGVVATGTFDTSGVNATPNVIAAQWVAAERTGVEVSEADLIVAQSVAESVVGVDGVGSVDATTQSPSFAEHLRSAATQNARSGSEGAHASVAEDIVDAGLLAQSAVQRSGTDRDAATKDYAASSEAARRAVSTSDTIAADAATSLNTGSRSGLTAAVGGVATLVLIGILIWLALMTRRIVNVRLLIATAITGWLTYVSLNPAALPVNYDQAVGDASQTATALEDVLQARSAQYAVALGLEDRVTDAVDRATKSVNALGQSTTSSSWRSATTGVDTLVTTEGAKARLEVIAGTQDAFTQTAQSLRTRLDEQLSPSVSGVGTTATITAGVALLLGLVAAALAWTGLSQRLKDYR